jgi:hypothetical protein
MEMTQQPATIDTTAFHLAQITTTGEEIHSLAGPQEFENYRALVPFNDAVSAVIGMLVIGGVIVAALDVLAAVRRCRWDDRSAASFLLVTWLVLPVLAQISHRTPLYVHYFLIVLPAPFMLIGYLVARVSVSADEKSSAGSPLRLLRRWTALLAMTALGIFAVAQAYQVLTLQQFVASRPTPGGMGEPIGYYEQLVKLAREFLKQSGGAEIVVRMHGTGTNPDVDEAPAIFDFLLNDMPHRFEDVEQAAILYPATTYIVIDNDQSGTYPATDRLAVHGSMGYTDPPCDVNVTPARWSNGVSLLSAQLEPLKPGEKATLRLCLKIDRSAMEEYHWTAQLWDKAGRRWAQVDDNGYPSRYWRVGDVIIQSLMLDVPVDMPAGDDVLRVGQYTWPDVKPVFTIDVMGNPQSDGVEIPVRVEP